MARVVFGGSFGFPTGAAAAGPDLDPGTVWTARTGGSQITDLLTMRDQPIDHLTTELCAPNGFVQFQGPDDGTSIVWVQCSAADRIQMGAAGAADLTDLNANNLTAGTVDGARLAPGTLLLDPATYLSAFGEGFVMESEDGDFDVPTSEVRWGVAHPLNGEAIDAVAGEFPEDLSLDPPFAYTARSIGINQPGLYIVEWRIVWDTFTSDAGSSGYTVQVELPSSDSRLYTYLPDDDREAYGHFVTWLPETNVRLKILDIDWGTAVLGYAFLRVAPLFPLVGVTPSADL